MTNQTPVFSDDELLDVISSLRSRRPDVLRRARRLPCSDCAVHGGLYLVFSEAIKRFGTEEEKQAMSRSWYCHETPSLACRGNIDHIGIAIDSNSTPRS
jgi:hypothetical protein